MGLKLEDDLVEAVKIGDVGRVRSLLALGADPNAGLFSDSTALFSAVQGGNREIVGALLRYNPRCCLKSPAKPERER